MKRKWILSAALLFGLALSAVCSGQDGRPLYPVYRGLPLSRECVVKEQRDDRYQNLLRVSVKVSVNGGAGSGTICHYDPSDGLAYVISCGHLWSGDKKYDPNDVGKARITVWYHEGPRLDRPASYDAEVLFWSNRKGHDVSLLRFRPDWKAPFAPIAPDFVLQEGTVLNSMGCDEGREVARYEVVVSSSKGQDLTTRLNSPRPGRSGGGLLTDEGMLVGICWGTSDTSSGDGTGFFTPLSAIEKVFRENDHVWLLETLSCARSIPVVDEEDPSAKYDQQYLPLPLR